MSSVSRIGIVCAVFILILAGQAGAWAAESGKIAFVQDGQPRAIIVTGREANAAEKFAAAELAEYIEKMSGAKLPVAAAGKGTRILVGTPKTNPEIARVWPGAAKDLKALGREGFILKTVGRDVVVTGVPERGVLYAAYDLLERLGCRFFTPGDIGECIPKEKTLVLDALDVSARPALSLRGNGPPDWAAKNKLSLVWSGSPLSNHGTSEQSEVFKESGLRGLEVLHPGFHDHGCYFPPDKYMEKLAGEKPGLFDKPFVNEKAIQDRYHKYLEDVATEYPEQDLVTRDRGKVRRRRGAEKIVQNVCCWTDPWVIDQASNNAKAYLRAHPEVTILELGTIEGSGPGCRCPRCRKAGEGYKHGEYAAMVKFAIEVGKQIREKIPHLRLSLTPFSGHWGMHELEAPPWLIVHHPSRCMGKPEAWLPGYRHENYLRYQYWGQWSQTPLPVRIEEKMLAEIRRADKEKWGGFTHQGGLPIGKGPCEHYTPWQHIHPWTLYLMARAQWAPGLDWKPLFDDFITRYYEEAAGPARRFYDATAARKSGLNISRHLTKPDRAELRGRVEKMLIECGRSLEDMKKLARSDKVKARVTQLEMILLCARSRGMPSLVEGELAAAKDEAARKAVAVKRLPGIEQIIAEVGSLEQFKERFTKTLGHANPVRGGWWPGPNKRLWSIRDTLAELVGKK